MALISKNVNTQHTSELSVLITRKRGGEFFVKPIKGRENAYRVLGNVEAGTIQVPLRDGGVEHIDAAGLTCNVVLTEDEMMTLRELSLNAYTLKGSFSARINDREEFEDTILEGSVWAEPVGDMDLEPSQATAVSAESVRKAADAAKARRATYLASAGAGSEVKAPTPAMD